MEEEGEDDVGPFEVFGVHRLELAPGSKSGYVGVRRNNSNKRPAWQAWVSLKAEKRRTVGCFKDPVGMLLWPEQWQRPVVLIYFGAYESRLRANQVPVRASCPDASLLLSVLRSGSLPLLDSHGPGQEHAQRKAH